MSKEISPNGLNRNSIKVDINQEFTSLDITSILFLFLNFRFKKQKRKRLPV